LSPWPEEPDANGVKVRNIAYTLSLGYSIGPKYSPSTERQVSTISCHCFIFHCWGQVHWLCL